MCARLAWAVREARAPALAVTDVAPEPLRPPAQPAPRPAPSGAPYLLAGGEDAALLLHGLTGSPHELRPVADALHARGFTCRGALMAGHGGSPERLRGLPWRAWVDAADAELDALRAARRVFLVGCSMGALVACALAHARPGRVAGLALLAPALRLQAAGRLAALLGRAPLTRRLVVGKAAGSDVRDAAARRENPGMRAVPLAAVAELRALARHVDALLPAIPAPALVVVGGRDHTVARGGAERLAARLGRAARLVVLPASGHLVGIDLERARCADEVVRFFTER